MIHTARIAASLTLLLSCNAWSQLSSSQIPEFTATVLTGASVSSSQLMGQPTVLIVTPSKDAAKDTRLWAQALRSNLDPDKVFIRDVLAIDLPFFISEEDALERAKDKIPARYQDQTWLLNASTLETALGIAHDSANAFVFVLDAQGQIVARMEGEPTTAKINELEHALAQSR